MEIFIKLDTIKHNTHFVFSIQSDSANCYCHKKDHLLAVVEVTISRLFKKIPTVREEY